MMDNSIHILGVDVGQIRERVMSASRTEEWLASVVHIALAHGFNSFQPD
jgi:hypothetical protein